MKTTEYTDHTEEKTKNILSFSVYSVVYPRSIFFASSQ